MYRENNSEGISRGFQKNFIDFYLEDKLIIFILIYLKIYLMIASRLERHDSLPKIHFSQFLENFKIKPNEK